jgi:hypothetical protein
VLENLAAGAEARHHLDTANAEEFPIHDESDRSAFTNTMRQNCCARSMSRQLTQALDRCWSASMLRRSILLVTNLRLALCETTSRSVSLGYPASTFPGRSRPSGTANLKLGDAVYGVSESGGAYAEVVVEPLVTKTFSLVPAQDAWKCRERPRTREDCASDAGLTAAPSALCRGQR